MHIFEYSWWKMVCCLCIICLKVHTGKLLGTRGVRKIYATNMIGRREYRYLGRISAIIILDESNLSAMLVPNLSFGEIHDHKQLAESRYQHQLEYLVSYQVPGAHEATDYSTLEQLLCLPCCMFFCIFTGNQVPLPVLLSLWGSAYIWRSLSKSTFTYKVEVSGTVLGLHSRFPCTPFLVPGIHIVLLYM